MTRVALLTKEYPPEIYGGAGVHVEHLSRELAKLLDVAVYCFGEPRDDPLVAGAYEPWDAIGKDGKGTALRALSADLCMAFDVEAADVAHSHTWYANFAGYLAHILYDIPHVMTSHSLEPLRPWKAEQLGAGYRLSSWVERTAIESADAVIAVSRAMRDDVLRVYPAVDAAKVKVVHNGIDTDEFFPDPRTACLQSQDIDPDVPYVLFVGRVTRQKGITYLLEAARSFDPDAQVVFCVGAPDTPEIEREVRAQVSELAESRKGVFWVEEMVPRPALVQIISHASVFVCPSIYEPFGLINVEAMACAVPVVASAVGGVPEIVVDGETGFLVPFAPSGDAFGTPADPEAFTAAIAERVNHLLSSPELARAFGAAGRERVLAQFTWKAVARQTVDVYDQVTGG
ncbi:MAG: glycogen synthase [Acidimicrobiales bacterium]